MPHNFRKTKVAALGTCTESATLHTHWWLHSGVFRKKCEEQHPLYPKAFNQHYVSCIQWSFVNHTKLCSNFKLVLLWTRTYSILCAQLLSTDLCNNSKLCPPIFLMQIVQRKDLLVDIGQYLISRVQLLVCWQTCQSRQFMNSESESLTCNVSHRKHFLHVRYHLLHLSTATQIYFQIRTLVWTSNHIIFFY